MLSIVRQARHFDRYSQIVDVLARHGFGYLLAQLGLESLLPWQQRVIMRQQQPPLPTSMPERLRHVLIELGPTFVKIGQFLSTRHDILPPDFAEELGKLQDAVPSFPPDQAIHIIETELGKPIHVLFKTFDRQPLAAASLGQVHSAVLPDGAQVVVKVQRPDIETIVETDMEIIADMAALAQKHTNLGGSQDLEELAWEFSTTLRREMDYQRERRNAERFRKIFQESPYVRIPITYEEYTSRHVLTLERFFGIKINDISALKREGIDPVQLANNCIQLIAMELFSGFFHADPHPGNFFAFPGDIIGAIDFGQVGILDQSMAQQVLRLVVAMTNHDTNEAVMAFEGMGIIKRQNINRSIRRDVHLWMESVTDIPLNEVSASETTSELFTMVRRHSLSMPGPVATLLRSLSMMEGIGRQLDPNLDVIGTVKPFAQQAMAERLSPQAIGEQFARRGRVAFDDVVDMPEQVSNLLRRINDGELQIQTREMELRDPSYALSKSINWLSFSVVVAAFILSFGRVVQEILSRLWPTQTVGESDTAISDKQ
jgi:ubiquinone biosynthesis protein